jgi:hypothetical protein
LNQFSHRELKERPRSGAGLKPSLIFAAFAALGCLRLNISFFVLRTSMPKSFRGLRKFSCRPVAIQNGDLLAPRRQERPVRKFNFFAAFARDIPSFGYGSPALRPLRLLFIIQPNYFAAASAAS